ncbi:MAG: hypothetical protein ACYTG7_20845 [Planctomycetota bacterium]|jgi:hypothetical protein
MPGVIDTLPGFLDGKEVVEVTFDPAEISYEELVKKADEARCATAAFTRNEAQQKTAAPILGERAKRNDYPVKPDKEPRYYLSKTPLRYVPMTAMQAMRVNAHLKRPGHLALLSPSQRKLLETIQDKPDAGWKDVIGQEISKAWRTLPREK